MTRHVATVIYRNCRVYWGSHGCRFDRGHGGPHECDCCNCSDHAANNLDEDGVKCIAKPPYYGAITRFYGEDAALHADQMAREGE